VSAGRIIGAGLVAAGVLIVALCLGVLYALDREGRVHQDAIDQLERSDRVEAVRSALADLGHAARLAATSASGGSSDAVERAAATIESGLEEMEMRDATGPGAVAAKEIDRLARLAVLNARSVASARGARGKASTEAAAREAELLAAEASSSLERELDARGASLNRDAARQIRAGRTLRIAVTVALAGALGLLAIVFTLYRTARHRERAALARIEQLAHFDSLTALPNRALIRDRLHHEAARSRRSGRPFTVLLFDLDGFKAVNDTWGHAAGDAALKQAATRAHSALRNSDTAGRLGGDEFLAILPETTAQGAVSVAEKLRMALREPYALSQGTARMSASIGIASWPADAEDEDALLHAADTALYSAKRHGKDRVEQARAAEPAAATIA
jgi:diguanylate cyclase (GGDEF)-like protein